MIPPGSTIGIFGGGQLGKMLATAAAQLGYRTHMYAPDEAGPLTQVATDTTIADDRDETALSAFAGAVDVVTYEFENVPLESIRFLEDRVPVRPGSRALAITQDRLKEKTFVRDHTAIEPAAFDAVDSLSDLRKVCKSRAFPTVLKTRRMGYDGKGQARLNKPDDAEDAWQSIGEAPAILEDFIDFDCEISVIIARGADGTMASYGPVENDHGDHILRRSRIPARIGADLADQALEAGADLARALDYVGVLTVELFVDGDRLLFNEIAPRVHNSGHWTIEAAITSQFEQHIRAICDLPLGDTALISPATMDNLIGDEIKLWPELLAERGAHLHVYGKAEIRPGRKMGHVTRLSGGKSG